MGDHVHRLEGILAKTAGRQVRRQFLRQSRENTREVVWLRTKGTPELDDLDRAGWTIERLKVVAVLDAYNTAVLGPLVSAVPRDPACSLGLDIPISFGAQTLTREERARILRAEMAFSRACASIKVPIAALGQPSSWHMVKELHYQLGLKDKQRDD